MRKVFPLLLIGIFLLPFCRKKGGEAYIFSSATVEAEQSRLSSIVKSRIKKILVQEGDKVEKGQVLALLETEEFEIQRSEAEAMMEELQHRIKSLKSQIEQLQVKFRLVEKNYRRAKNLLKKQAISVSKFEKTETEFFSFKKSIESLQEQRKALESKKKALEERIALLNYYIENCRIKAPFGGIVQEIIALEGEVVLPSAPVLTLTKMEQVWARMYVEEKDLGFVRIGQKAMVKVDSFPERKFWGKVVWVSPEAEFIPKNIQTREERATLVYAVKIAIENREGIFKIGMPVEIYLKK